MPTSVTMTRLPLVMINFRFWLYLASSRNRRRCVLAIEVVREDWLTIDEARELTGCDGYIFQPVNIR